MYKPVLVVMARWPAAGRCKNRLASKIGSKQAAKIQRHLTSHTLEVAKAVARRGLVELQIAYTGISPRSAAKKWGGLYEKNFLFPQGNGTLGLRMRRQVIRVQRRNHPKLCSGRSTILIGTDLPELCEQDLLLALEALSRVEIVLGPAFDGGYWLIGLAGRLVKPVSTWPFCGIPWGTNQVLQKTLQNAKLIKAKYELLEVKNDLDIIEDFAPWKP